MVYDESEMKFDVNMTLFKVQSRINKEMALIHCLLEQSNEIRMVAETWLRNSDSGKLWIHASELSKKDTRLMSQ